MQVRQLGTYIGEFLLRESARFAAMRAIVQGEQTGDLVEAEAQALGRLDESDPRHIGLAVAPGENCKTLLRPQSGDCCVFCSFGLVKCPPVQAQRQCCGEGQRAILADRAQVT